MSRLRYILILKSHNVNLLYIVLVPINIFDGTTNDKLIANFYNSLNENKNIQVILCFFTIYDHNKQHIGRLTRFPFILSHVLNYMKVARPKVHGPRLGLYLASCS